MQKEKRKEKERKGRGKAHPLGKEVQNNNGTSYALYGAVECVLAI